MNKSRRRLLMLCCQTNSKARTTDAVCPKCQQAGELHGTCVCTSCGFTATKKCTSCAISYCNDCGQIVENK